MTEAPGPSGPTIRRATFTESMLIGLTFVPFEGCFLFKTSGSPDLAHLGRDEDHQDERGGQLCAG